MARLANTKLVKIISIICSVILAITLFMHCDFKTYAGGEMYIYNTVLNEEQQAVYNQVYENIIAFNERIFKLVTPLSHDDLYITMNAVYNDHPELFWVNTSYKYGYNADNLVIQLKLSYCISKDALASATIAFNNAVDNIVSQAAAFPTDLERERAIHDLICDLATYNAVNAKHQSAYSALVEGTSVCAGYSRAFQLSCQKLGIVCYYVTGMANGEEHAWNIVRIGGNFYNVDITGDDTINETLNTHSYQYFNVTDGQIAHNHIRSELSAMLPACNAI
ncbi:Transglutaminase-like superfamily protein [Pseudobutyrivibrio sp. YE44]|uniref:transglutaminase domain-containing protein n=1 Tax=Pseudobutyrivibrio sp. YE44 TaxID=1520802 RepID=UPI0008904D41|nr:transglutaminase domain-containing protein [Pseudobutyrivibrio sp. YE44]SDB04831.1 Transglutaminase-like superfamily protein [Pseudobutyrivibrio sp. YE44]